MTLDREASADLAQPVASIDDLVDYFRAGEKPRERWRLGVEHEKLGLRVPAIQPLPYEGPGGVEDLLRRIAREPSDPPWHAIEEDGHVMGLDGPGSVSLEPGAQLEQNGQPLVAMADVCAEFQEHLAFLRRVSEPLGIVWLGLGCHPFHKTGELPRVPRERYRIMRQFLPARGGLAMDMMHATASVQASFDWSDEADLVEKLRMALAVTPIASALFANSSLWEGRPSGWISRRMAIWRDTDPDRCGLLPQAFEPDFGYRRYAEWALDIPMFFLVREGRYRPLDAMSFRRFWQEGIEGEHATLADWDRHLTTIFPEVRIKRVLEVRNADAVPPSLLCTMPALWKGLLYDADARIAAAALAPWDVAERDAVHVDVARRGLAAATPSGAPLLPLARELVRIAGEGLRRQAPRGVDESRHLEPLEELVARGRSPGEEVLARWQGDWAGRPDRLIEYARY
ncbi:glutamate--cysteine ligase [Myxococcota bacterium]|nr:glutamate--cysteine ligase [Myxococcota bacterium]